MLYEECIYHRSSEAYQAVMWTNTFHFIYRGKTVSRKPENYSLIYFGNKYFFS